jgi:hypothetical protein
VTTAPRQCVLIPGPTRIFPLEEPTTILCITCSRPLHRQGAWWLDDDSTTNCPNAARHEPSPLECAECGQDVDIATDHGWFETDGADPYAAVIHSDCYWELVKETELMVTDASTQGE